MRTLLSITLLLTAMSASMPLAAQGRLSTQGEMEIARTESSAAASEEEQRKALADARRRLDEAAREVARLSTQLGRHERNEFVFVDGGPRRAILGVQLDPRSGKEGARVLKVSPGGAAEEAGLQDGDVIVSLDGRKVAGDGSDRAVLEHMREVKPDQKVKVRVLRAGKNRDFVVVARPMAFGAGMFSAGMPAMGTAVDTVIAGLPQVRRLGPFWPGEFGGMELASITPKLGAYFGASEGVLVVQAPDNAAFKLEDGDVIQAIDGRKPDDGAHALRILRSYQPGEKVSLTVLRQRKPVTLAVAMPERRHFEYDMLEAVPGVPPAPPSPPAPMSPAGATAPGGTGSFE